MDGFHPFPLFEFEFHGAINVTTPSKLNQSWIQFARSLSADFWARLIDSVADSSSELFHWVIESRAMELPFPLFPFLFLFYFPNSGSSHVIQLSGFIARLSISFERDAFINRVWLELHGGAFLFFVCLELNRSGGACNQKTIQCNPKNNPAATWFHWLENWPVVWLGRPANFLRTLPAARPSHFLCWIFDWTIQLLDVFLFTFPYLDGEKEFRMISRNII